MTYPRAKHITRWEVFTVPPIGRLALQLLGYHLVSSVHPPCVAACGNEPGVKKMRAALLRSGREKRGRRPSRELASLHTICGRSPRRPPFSALSRSANMRVPRLCQVGRFSFFKNARIAGRCASSSEGGPLSFRSSRYHVGYKLAPTIRRPRRTGSGKHKPRRFGTRKTASAKAEITYALPLSSFRYPMTDVRAITPNRSGLSRPNCEIISSVRPSAR
jgi:hypothetical protein